MENKVSILILNYNSWEDTLECLESVTRLHYPSYEIIVCDNLSSNNSMEHIKAWAEGKETPPHLSPQLEDYLLPLTPKPIPYVFYTREKALQGGDKEKENTTFSPTLPRLILIQNDRNEGFSEGNNLMMRYVLSQGTSTFLWLLNNDTVVHPLSLSEFVQKAREYPQGCMIGSKTLLYEKPDLVYTLAGGTIDSRYSTHWIDFGKSQEEATSEENVKPDFITGSSCFLSLKTLKRIGLLPDGYFMYYEDVDWALRAKNAQIPLLYASKSIIWHKKGILHEASTPSRRQIKIFSKTISWPDIADSLMDYYYAPRNKIVTIKRNLAKEFSRRFVSYFLAWLFRWSLLILLFQDHKIARLSLLWRAFFDALTNRLGKTLDLEKWKRRYTSL
ncbi:glycosyltransferase [Thermospira aquatica]|uniref:Glycosyltransferase family 2 protein n=1 Tax=Thermospira aquatica TaxID=2828656 RepID=A0AAX3BF68_9SPIR|nr:glycosyltransferase family 2 protein [Thermospira aquatica]URA10866.1 glycosyltransferase family 2 protein [Thermospira aquatica]